MAASNQFSEEAVGALYITTGDARGSAQLQYLAGVSSNQEGIVRIYSFDAPLVTPIQDAIQAQWPHAKIEYLDGTIFVSPPGPNARAGGYKVAIVGVEGSGKTVMLAGLGALYSQPDQKGYFLSPKTFETTTYVNRQMSALLSGTWPAATNEDLMQGLDWDLRQRDGDGRPKKVAELSFLDFAGEVYRAAFVRKTGPKDTLSHEVEKLRHYLLEADDVLVLVNLSDVIAHGPFSPRVEESVWITNAILNFVLPEDNVSGRKMPRAAIVLSQSDSYEDTIASCGGPKGTLQKYLPHVANNYGWLDTFAVCTVDKTILDDDGNKVPAPDFTTKGLSPIMEWILSK